MQNLSENMKKPPVVSPQEWQAPTGEHGFHRAEVGVGGGHGAVADHPPQKGMDLPEAVAHAPGADGNFPGQRSGERRLRPIGFARAPDRIRGYRASRATASTGKIAHGGVAPSPVTPSLLP